MMKGREDDRSMRGSSTGFTLVEIMVTLAVIALMAALAAPGIILMAPDMALKTAARDLFSRLQEAKMLAIKENEPVTFRITGSYYYIDLDGDENCTLSAVDTFTDSNGDGVYTRGEPFVDVDANGQYSGEVAINFNDYGYGIAKGTGNATANWSGNSCKQAELITFKPRGSSNSGSIYLENRNRDISYAVTVLTAGSIKTRKYSGSKTFDKDYWK